MGVMLCIIVILFSKLFHLSTTSPTESNIKTTLPEYSLTTQKYFPNISITTRPRNQPLSNSLSKETPNDDVEQLFQSHTRALKRPQTLKRFLTANNQQFGNNITSLQTTVETVEISLVNDRHDQTSASSSIKHNSEEEESSFKNFKFYGIANAYQVNDTLGYNSILNSYGLNETSGITGSAKDNEHGTYGFNYSFGRWPLNNVTGVDLIDDIENPFWSSSCDSHNSTSWTLTWPVCSTKFQSLSTFIGVTLLLGLITLWTVVGNILVLWALYR